MPLEKAWEREPYWQDVGVGVPLGIEADPDTEIDPPAPPVQRSDGTLLAPRLLITGSGDSNSFGGVVDDDPEYLKWLKVVILRLMCRTPAVACLKKTELYSLVEAVQFLGIENYEEYATGRTLNSIRQGLEELLCSWEATLPPDPVFPSSLRANLRSLGTLVNLSVIERNLLGIAVVIHLENCIHIASGMLPFGLPNRGAERILSVLLKETPSAVEACLRQSGTLARTGLLSVDLRARDNNLCAHLDLFSGAFAAEMLREQADVRDIAHIFIRPAPQSRLRREQFAHARSDIDVVESLIRHAFLKRQHAVNILIFGRPGTGKTELARLLAAELGFPLVEVASDQDGEPISARNRLRNYCVAQQILAGTQTLILFDEVEEALLPPTHPLGQGEKEMPRKSWLNQLLERNQSPAIWIANSVSDFDDAYLRRFTFAFELSTPDKPLREQLVQAQFRGIAGPAVQQQIASHPNLTPAMLTQVASLTRIVASDRPLEEREAVARHVLNQSLRTQGATPIALNPEEPNAWDAFRPEWINSDLDLHMLKDSLRSIRRGRICVFGSAGTGKTAFAKWLSASAEMQYYPLTARDLMDPRPGAFERNIDYIFDVARRQSALLHFDEAECLLFDEAAFASDWGRQHTDAFLRRLETYEGLILASTKSFREPDSSSLRVFDVHIRFDYSTSETVRGMFARACEILALGTPSDLHLRKISMLRYLAPGDFEQVIRRARLLRFSDPEHILGALEAVVAMKMTGRLRKIGFVEGR